MRTFCLYSRHPRGKTLRTPLLAALPLACITWAPLSTTAAQQLTRRATTFENLADSERVRLAVSHTAGRYEGRLLQRGPDQLVLSAQDVKVNQVGWPEPLRVAPTMVDTLWVARRATGKGAGIGALVGLAAGAIAGAVACADCEDTPPEALTVGGAAVGALFGALVGAGIGSTGRRWVRQYPK